MLRFAISRHIVRYMRLLPKISFNYKPTHIVQALVQLSVYTYWGYFYFGVREYAPFIIGQLIFAYAFHFTLTAFTKKEYVLSFALFPIVFSINLFAWFRPEFYFCQLLLIMVAILGKQYLTRKLDGKLIHIFNPSALPLAILAILVVLARGEPWLMTQDVTTSFYLVPHFYLYVFLVGCISQWLAGTALIAFGAAAMMIFAYYLSVAFTGLPLMNAMIHGNVFLAMTLLITDPATTPKTTSGRLILGFIYGLSIIFAYGILMHLDAPTHYDKVLFVPLLNLLAPYFDKIPACVPQLNFTLTKRLQLALYMGLMAIFLRPIQTNDYLWPHVLQASQIHWRQPLDPRLESEIKQHWLTVCAANPKSNSCISRCYRNKDECP